MGRVNKFLRRENIKARQPDLNRTEKPEQKRCFRDCHLTGRLLAANPDQMRRPAQENLSSEYTEKSV
jgi:hypothetical protein